ncbi:hypothetical protein ACQEU3_44550 [Spirillospora sp. CA-253888]
MSHWPPDVSSAARTELETTLGLALHAAETMLEECEPIPPVAVRIDRVSGEREIAFGHTATQEVGEAFELIWADLGREAEGLQCVAVAASAKAVGNGKAESIVYVVVEHRDGHTVKAVLPYQRRRRLTRHKVIPGALTITPHQGRIWQ